MYISKNGVITNKLIDCINYIVFVMQPSIYLQWQDQFILCTKSLPILGYYIGSVITPPLYQIFLLSNINKFYMFSNLSILRFVLPDLTCLKVLNLSLPVAILSLDCLSKVDSGIEGSLACSISSLSSYEGKNTLNVNLKVTAIGRYHYIVVDFNSNLLNLYSFL